MATKYDIIKSPPSSSGLYEGMWEVLSRYADPDYQRQIKADEENQRRYELSRDDALRREAKSDAILKKQQDDLRRNQIYQLQEAEWTRAKAGFDEMYAMIGDDPRDRDKFLKQWPGIDKKYTITQPDGSVRTETLAGQVSTLTSMNEDNLDNINTYDNLKESWSGLPREERIAHYPEFEQAALDANKVLAPSIVEQHNRDLSYGDNEDVLNLLLSDEFLPVEMKTPGPDGVTPAQKIKNLLLKDDKITDADLSTLNSYIARQFKDAESYKKFMEKLHMKSIDALGSLKMDSDQTAINAINQLYIKSGVELGRFEPKEFPKTKAQIEAEAKEIQERESRLEKISELGYGEEDINTRVYQLAGGIVPFNSLTDENQSNIISEAVSSLIAEGEKHFIKKVDKPTTKEEKAKLDSIKLKPEDKRFWLGETEEKVAKEYRRRQSEYRKKDPLWQRTPERKSLVGKLFQWNWPYDRPNRAELGYGTEYKNEIDRLVEPDTTKDPISGKYISRKELIDGLINRPLSYAKKGYVLDLTNTYNILLGNGAVRNLTIGYKKMSPKEALSYINSDNFKNQKTLYYNKFK